MSTCNENYRNWGCILSCTTTIMYPYSAFKNIELIVSKAFNTNNNVLKICHSVYNNVDVICVYHTSIDTPLAILFYILHTKSVSNFDLLAWNLTNTGSVVINSLCAPITSTLHYMQNSSTQEFHNYIILTKITHFALNFSDNFYFFHYSIWFITPHGINTCQFL